MGDVEHFDVVVVGAGLSGVGAGRHLQVRCPQKSYVILEAREAIGGTWDLFRYPGVRSDSDMHTLGYAFKPWTGAKALADGPSILNYVRETAAEYGVDRHIRFRHKVTSAAWSSADARWTVEAQGPDGPARFSCNFLLMCSGYYDYTAGYTPDFAGLEDFRGRFVHPQQWPQDLDYAGKRVVVIGSGATAVTLVPAMAGTAAHVTMLQRSPTYVFSRPAKDSMSDWLRKRLPAMAAYQLIRWRNVLFQMVLYNQARAKPELAKKRILDLVRRNLGPDYDLSHFTPRYNVWDQRVCLVPDADLFEAIKAGTADVVTDRIDRFVPEGIRLESGKTLLADVVVSATGLRLLPVGGMAIVVDGVEVKPRDTLAYKGMMFSGVPNLVCVFGYTNASWTLKADLTSEFVCRILNHMDATGTAAATPIRPAEPVEELPWLDFTSGYVQRAMDDFPKQGPQKPWRLHQNYALDMMALRFGKLEDGSLRFTKAAGTAFKPAPASVSAREAA
jgi:cation diffusion facilitator CzcD-associated flavoprotein CzcO